MKLLSLVLCVLILSGCSAQPMSVSKTENPEIKVESLFTYKGYEVVRFDDGGYHRYFVIGNRLETMTEHYEGKTSFPEQIQTINYDPV